MAKILKGFVIAAKESVEDISSEAVEKKLGSPMLLLDVRKPGELQTGFLPSAPNVP